MHNFIGSAYWGFWSYVYVFTLLFGYVSGTFEAWYVGFIVLIVTAFTAWTLAWWFVFGVVISYIMEQEDVESEEHEELANWVVGPIESYFVWRTKRVWMSEK